MLFVLIHTRKHTRKHTLSFFDMGSCTSSNLVDEFLPNADQNTQKKAREQELISLESILRVQHEFVNLKNLEHIPKTPEMQRMFEESVLENTRQLREMSRIWRSQRQLLCQTRNLH